LRHCVSSRSDGSQPEGKLEASERLASVDHPSGNLVSRPARLCERLRQSRVFEVDHADTALRKAALAESVYADTELAPTVPVSIDFARDSAEKRLREAGLQPEARTIWVWEGVSMYLPEQAVRDTLALCSGSGRQFLLFLRVGGVGKPRA
jgi:O-methyltransferase involved in polyketide biosynthesis